MKKTTEREVDIAVWRLLTNSKSNSNEVERLAQKAFTAIKQDTELPTRITNLIENDKQSNDSNH